VTVTSKTVREKIGKKRHQAKIMREVIEMDVRLKKEKEGIVARRAWTSVQHTK